MIRHYPILHMKNGEWKPDGRMLGTLCGMGIPMGLQYSITAIGSVVLQTAVNSLGSMAVAAVSTGSKVSMFFCCPFDALGGTMATYAGQNVGAKKLDRVKEGLKAASLIGIIYSVIAFVILFFGGKYIALLFMDADQTEIIGRVAMFLIGNSMFYIPLTFVNVVRFTIQGMGFSTFAILAGVCEMAARSLVGFCLVPVFGFLPACFASPLAWIFADAFLIPAFFHCMKKLKVLFGKLHNRSGTDHTRGCGGGKCPRLENHSRRYEKMARNSYDMDDNMKSSESETYDKTKNQSRNSQNRSENSSQNRTRNSSRDSMDNGRNCKR